MRNYRRALVCLLFALMPAPAQSAECLDSDAREKVRALMLEGIDAGFKQHVVHIFDGWIKDQSNQPARAIRGMRNGIVAYARSRAVALKWSLPTCKESP